jgi:hypothetical protein
MSEAVAKGKASSSERRNEIGESHSAAAWGTSEV